MASAVYYQMPLVYRPPPRRPLIISGIRHCLANAALSALRAFVALAQCVHLAASAITSNRTAASPRQPRRHEDHGARPGLAPGPADRGWIGYECVCPRVVGL